MKRVYFAAGCFWGVEELFSRLEGVVNAVSGYMGGEIDNPTYEQVCMGNTGHAEVVEVTYDETIIDYISLLKYFFRMHDPTTINRQGPNIGSQYRSAIFYQSQEELSLLKGFIDELINKKIFKNPIVTSLEPYSHFYVAEDYHQDYYLRKYQGKSGPICHYLVDLDI